MGVLVVVLVPGTLLHCIKECPFLVVQLLLLIVWKCLTLILKKTLRFGWNTMYR